MEVKFWRFGSISFSALLLSGQLVCTCAISVQPDMRMRSVATADCCDPDKGHRHDSESEDCAHCLTASPGEIEVPHRTILRSIQSSVIPGVLVMLPVTPARVLVVARPGFPGGPLPSITPERLHVSLLL